MGRKYMSGAGQKAPDRGPSGVLESALRDCVSALKYTLNKHVITGSRIERWIEI
jgi:hypothetical protein